MFFKFKIDDELDDTLNGRKFETCEQDGAREANHNFNCSQVPESSFFDDELTGKCNERYMLSCKIAKMTSYCNWGSSDLQFGRNGKCEPLNEGEFEFGMDFYVACCQACRRGLADATIIPYSSGANCKRELPINSTLGDSLLLEQMEKCCWHWSESIGDQTGVCDKLNCEQECDGEMGLCLCRDGYRIDEEDGQSCLDVDECSSNTACESGQRCFNLPGTYQCVDAPTDASTDAPVKRKSKIYVNNFVLKLKINFYMLITMCLFSLIILGYHH